MPMLKFKFAYGVYVAVLYTMITSKAETVSFILLGLLALLTVFTEDELRRHHTVLAWFALHIKLDPKSTPDDMPEDLKHLVGKE